MTKDNSTGDLLGRQFNCNISRSYKKKLTHKIIFNTKNSYQSPYNIITNQYQNGNNTGRVF